MKKGKIKKNYGRDNLMYTYGVEWLNKKGEMRDMLCDRKFLNYDNAYADSVRFAKEAKIKTGKITIFYGKFLIDEVPINI